MKIISSVFEQKGEIPKKYTCDGSDVSPPLAIEDVPEGTESLVLIVDDPDAVSVAGKVWVHWTAWNISPETSEISEDSVPDEAIEGMTDFNHPGWGGPCPPSGTHQYHFKLYALDRELTLKPSAKKDEIEDAMEGHIIEECELIGVYTRN